MERRGEKMLRWNEVGGWDGIGWDWGGTGRVSIGCRMVGFGALNAVQCDAVERCGAVWLERQASV